MGGIHKPASVMLNMKLTLSCGGGLAHERSHRIHSQELLLLALPFVLLATGILNDLLGLKSCRCDNIGLVSLILLGWELRVLSHSTVVLCIQVM